MMLGNLAQPYVISIGPDDSLDKAISLMEEHEIRHLPVIEAGRAVGMVSDRDVLLAVGWKLEVEREAVTDHEVVGPRTVREIMSSPALYLDPKASPADAARMMVEGSFHALLVIRDSTVLGVVTSTDLLRLFSSYDHELLDRPITERMRANVKTIAPGDALFEASRLFKDSAIHHLPVVAGDQLLGILTDRDLRRACGEDSVSDELAEHDGQAYFGTTKVLEVMSHEVKTLEESASMRDACRLMSTHHIGCVPIVDHDRLVGIVTDTDCLRLATEIEQSTNI